MLTKNFNGGDMNKLLLACVLMLISGWGQAKVHGEEVSYKTATTELKGYLAYDDAIEGPRPAVLVVHEWWGHNDYARKRARMLAEMGYTALAVDMYGDGKQANHPDDATKFMQEAVANGDEARARFESALTLLKAHGTTDGERVAAIGYCFGGAVVLTMARAGLDLDAVVSFHGSIEPVGEKAQPGKTKAQVLVFNGEQDPFVKPESITAFKQEMDEAGVDYQFVNLPDALHSFTNPAADEVAKKFNMPLAYNATADKRSWQEMSELFDKLFK